MRTGRHGGNGRLRRRDRRSGQDLDTDFDEDIADLGVDEEIETGAADFESDIEADTAAGTTLDEEIETGATGAETFETETELTQDMDTGMPGEGTMDAQITASIEQACAWIDE